MTADDVKIRLRNAHKRFRGDQGDVAVLDGVDLEIREGEFFAIVGPSGCGKSTLLNCLAGFEHLTSGEVTIDGAPVGDPSPRRVFVFQEYAIFPWLSVADNVAFGLAGLRRPERDRIVARYVEMVGLQGFESAFPHELSGGMRQRVEFARALAVDPDMLFLDEPFGALDALTRMEMRREITRIWQETGKTCILVTHDVDEAVELADRVAVLSTRPAIVQRILDNPRPRPRDIADPECRALRTTILEVLGVGSSR
ncbi:ABC transporter ATP-binding protein [Paraliomyxa miuraensis]|uniref:ABC transporter ATP-binding protein n=1 Tax=Paraliomyxa miuraensis TaxID=376150 RepID=UPI0022510908|nr:ABC transporter ATP-binding protein [Paraliomyxa miuraensis]MCX4248027.1 ABC transporter ATP-binding protein [Paraliomyxa miuraensis]